MNKNFERAFWRFFLFLFLAFVFFFFPFHFYHRLTFFLF